MAQVWLMNCATATAHRKPRSRAVHLCRPGHRWHSPMKYIEPRPFADPEAAACELMEIANTTEAVRDDRIHIEEINGPFLFEFRGTPAEYGAGMKLAIERGWLWMHESGTYVKFTPAGAELFA